MAQMSNPFFGSKSIFTSNQSGPNSQGQNMRDWLSGKAAMDDINRAYQPVQNQFQANQYDPNASAYQIQNQYGGNLASAIAGAQGRNTPMATAAQAAGPDLVAANAAAAQQSALGNLLMQRASGTGGPSVAELQMRRGLDASIAAQRAQAASARGLSPGMAQRLAAQGIAQAQQQTNADAAMLRASEQLGAQNALGGVLSQQRGQDLGAAQMGLQAGQFNAGLQQQTNLANQSAEFQNRGQMDQALQNYLAMGMSREEAQQKAFADMEALKAQQQISANQLNQATAEANAEREQKAKGGFIQGVGGAIGSIGKLFSDERLKANIAPADKDVRGFLNALKAYSFDYKDEKHGGKENLGVMAQDLEKSRLGKKIVMELPEGKALDVKRFVSALGAAAAHLNQRVATLEGAR